MGSDTRPAENYDLIFGSNRITDCKMAVAMELPDARKDLFVLESNGGDLLLSMEIRDPEGKLLGKVRRNSFVFSDPAVTAERFVVDRIEMALTLTDTVTGKRLFEARRLDARTFEVNGEFYTDFGAIVATPAGIKIGGVTMSGNIIEGFGGAILIGPSGIAIGAQ